MDAISFVLGVRSAQLRSSQLKDLIYRAGSRRDGGDNANEVNGATNGDGMHVDGDDDDIPQEHFEEEEEEQARKAWVMAVYVDKDGKEWRYQRT